MTELAVISELLEQRGFRYSIDREVYFNPVSKTVFSIEFVEDHSVEELEELLSKVSNGENWQFYFNTPPSNAVQRELVGILE